ncbi:MCE family protein [Nocardia sp. NPDC052001]|uniref:MlaD family protein n=1 Tax=Nocardia sp. NPDC052001 TaxID=3154853 RepID=UPI0034393693
MYIDPSGRGLSAAWLALIGLLIAAVTTATVYLLGLRYTGAFADTVDVTARLTSTGDGLPQRADVKFRGMLVGQVGSSGIAAAGERQDVVLRIKPELAQSIPSTVTARVVPNNLFGVTAVELIDNGPSGQGLRTGATIVQDTSTVTTQLQATLTTLRTVLDAIDPIKLAHVLGSLADALDPAFRMPGSTIERLDTWTTEVRAIPGVGDLLGDLGAAASALNRSAPQLIDTLTESVTVARTLTDHRAGLVALLTSASGAVDATNDLFARNPGAGPELVGGLDQTFGALARDPDAIAASVADLNAALGKLSTVFNWGPDELMSWVMDLSFTPFQQYTARDCPRYGELAGPRCTAAAAPGSGSPLPSGLTQPASSRTGGLQGAEAISALTGGNPTAAQLMLLGPILTGGSLTVTDSTPRPGGR